MDSPKKVNITIDPALKVYADSNIVFIPNTTNSEISISSPDHFIANDSLNGYLQLWNLKTQQGMKTESKSSATSITIDPNSLDKFQENLNLFPEKNHNAIYAPDMTITEPEFFLNSSLKWAQPGGQNTPVTITYSYSNLLNGNLPGGLTNAEITGIIREAVGLWSRYAPLNFVEFPDSGPAPSDSSYNAGSYPQIRFGTHFIDGIGNVLADAYYPYSTIDGLAGDIHFDSSETWKASPSGGLDLLEVAVHELGHALGLRHESAQIAIMNTEYGGRYSGLGTAFIFQDDINGIQDIYGTRDLFRKQRWATGQGGFWDTQQWLVGNFNGDGKDDLAKAFDERGQASIDVHP
ncbi:matrixin family metalloprotease, partial [Nostoc sp. UHCC 0251]|nr:matrixin family metalloprotease [Nostoc sp. UHCC 0251]